MDKKKLEYQDLKQMGVSEKALQAYSESGYEFFDTDDNDIQVKINSEHVCFLNTEDDITNLFED